MNKVLDVQKPNLSPPGCPDRDGHGSVAVELAHGTPREDGKDAGVGIDTARSSRERGVAATIIIPAGYSLTNLAITDAPWAVDLPGIEIPASNILALEGIRDMVRPEAPE